MSLLRRLAPLLWLAVAPPVAAGEIAVHGVAAGRGITVESRGPWINGGFGRLTEGRDGEDRESLARGEAHVGLDWSPSATVLVHVHGTARTEPGAAGGWRAAFSGAPLDAGARRAQGELRVRF